MQISTKELNKSQTELTIEVSAEEARPFLEKAAVRLSKETKIEGFRPGRAPYDIVKQKLGEMNIYQEALDNIITHFYWQAVEQEKINTVSQPKIDLEKFAPGNPIIFKATVALMPKIKLGNYKSIKVKKNKAEVETAEVDKVIKDIRKMQVKEILEDKPAEKDDRVEVDFTVSLDKVVIEDGTGKKYPVVIGEGFMVPGFEDQLIGMKKDEEKSFQLKFPEKYQNSMVAGKLCDFKVKMLNVYKRELPEVTDEWAKSVGAENIQNLKSKIKKNLEDEKKFHEEQRAEIEMLKKIIEQTEFSDIPDVLVENEAHRMVHEFADSISQQGLNFDDYLKNINKDKKQLEEEFRPKALERVKTSLIIKEIAEQENILPKDKEIEEELKRIESQIDSEEAKRNIRSDGYKQYVTTIVRNRKVIEMLKSLIIRE
ncbi:trigger factor [Patescibacteria group bacterium]|nr:trigger factor [Patescibacteria group bacterium]